MLDVSSNLQFTKFDSPTEKHKQAVVDILKSLGGDVDDQGTLKQKVAKAQNVSPSTALRLINKAVEDGIIEAYVKGKKKGYSLK